MAITKAGTSVVDSSWHNHFKFVSSDGLDVTFSGGPFSNSVEQVVNLSNTIITLLDDAVNNIFIDFKSTPFLGLEDVTHNNKLLVYAITTASGAVSNIVDRRTPASIGTGTVGRARTLPARQGEVTVRNILSSGSPAGNTGFTSDPIPYAGFLDEWHFMCVTKAIGSDRKVYLDGTLMEGTFENSDGFTADSWFDDFEDGNTQTVTFGKLRPSSSSVFYDGWIANTGFLEDVLTVQNQLDLIAATTNAEFETELSNYTPEHYWSLQESAVPVIDQGDNAILHDLINTSGVPLHQEDGPHDTSDGSWYSIRFLKTSGTAGDYISSSNFTDFQSDFSARQDGSYFCWFKPGPNFFLGTSFEQLPTVKDTSISTTSQWETGVNRVLQGDIS